MSTLQSRVPLQGSERTALPEARAISAADPGEHFEVTVHLRPRSPISAAAPAAVSAALPQQRLYLSHTELAASSGADPADIAAIEAFARANGLIVTAAHAAQRSVVLSGTVAAFEAAFGVTLQQYEHPEGTYRGRTGAIYVPAGLAPIIRGVFGLDNRPQTKPHFRLWTPNASGIQEHAANGIFTPPQLAQLYEFPPHLNGQGQTIALIELGGGFRPADLQAYFGQLGIALPRVIDVGVDGGSNQPTGDPRSADTEVMLAIEVAGAIAHGARIVVYFAPNTDRGFLDAITTAIHDQSHTPSVISISWGNAESAWTGQAMQAFDQAFQDAAALGITICAAAGDNGSNDGVNDGRSHVDFPASSPHVLGCGGTPRKATGGVISGEGVWERT